MSIAASCLLAASSISLAGEATVCMRRIVRRLPSPPFARRGGEAS
jgi:hypothetical protein